jgi:hypothetical protein
MSIFREPGPQNVSEWLEIATKKLAPAAKERIRAEIVSHYDEAVDGHLQNGSPRSAAHTAALDELGDARAAARRFRRTHLTKYEFLIIARFLRSGQHNLWVLLVKVAFWLGFGWWICYFPEGFSILAYILIGLLIAYEVFTFLLARRRSPRLLVLMVSGYYLIFGVFWMTIVNTHMPFNEELFWCSLLMSPVFFGRSLFYFRLRNKLGKMGEDWMGQAGEGRSEFPPENPVAS